MNFDFFIELFIDNKLQKIHFKNKFSNKIFSLTPFYDGNNLKVSIKTNKKIILKTFYAVCNYNLSKNDRFFVNGYQSWTDSNEYPATGKMKRLSLFAKILNPFLKFKQYGDYNFFSQNLRKGEFYGFDYAYIRKNKDKFIYFCSNNANFVYTIIKFSVPNKKVYFFTDCKNVIIKKQAFLIDITISDKKSKFIIQKQNFKTKFVTGWTSWYNYYQNINQEIIIKNYNQFKKFFPEKSIFQIDDGFQTAVGDWLSINKKKFPNGLSAIVDKIHNGKYKAGLWLAPFVAQKNSEILKNHPDWVLKDKNRKKVYGGINWGGFLALDFYNEHFRDYLRNVFDIVLNKWNFDMVKLDFLYAVSIIPQHGKSRAMVMSEAIDFLVQITGNKQILACGVPVAQAVNKVDFCRIGSDVSLDWNGKFYEKWLHRERISTYKSLKNTIFRNFFDKKAFLNDPDVFLLRDNNIKLNKKQKITLFIINSIFGSLVFTSDDFSKYNKWQKQLIKNLHYFIKADVYYFYEINDLLEFHFSIENKNFIGFSNLSHKNKILNNPKSKKLNIFDLKYVQDNKSRHISSFETKIYAF